MHYKKYYRRIQDILQIGKIIRLKILLMKILILKILIVKIHIIKILTTKIHLLKKDYPQLVDDIIYGKDYGNEKDNPTKLCHNCHKLDQNGLKKCIHSDCPGLCESCHSQSVDLPNCLACQKSQDLDCPICYKQYHISELCPSDSCEHKICWQCFGNAYKSGNAINSCPICRKQFNHNYTVNGHKMT